jgi:hypothetical protein
MRRAHRPSGTSSTRRDVAEQRGNLQRVHRSVGKRVESVEMRKLSSAQATTPGHSQTLAGDKREVRRDSQGNGCHGVLGEATWSVSSVREQQDRKTAVCALDSPSDELQESLPGMGYTCVVGAVQRGGEGG